MLWRLTKAHYQIASQKEKQGEVEEQKYLITKGTLYFFSVNFERIFFLKQIRQFLQQIFVTNLTFSLNVCKEKLGLKQMHNSLSVMPSSCF